MSKEKWLIVTFHFLSGEVHSTDFEEEYWKRLSKILKNGTSSFWSTPNDDIGQYYDFSKVCWIDVKKKKSQQEGWFE